MALQLTHDQQASRESHEQAPNLWKKLLREGSRKSAVLPDASVFIFGDSGSGKSLLLHKICTTGTGTGGTGTGTESTPKCSKTFVEYNYLDVEDNLFFEGSEVTAASPVHIWSFDPHAFDSSFDCFQTVKSEDKILFAVVVDCSKPAGVCVEQLRKQVSILKDKVKIMEKRMGPEYMRKQKRSTATYLAHIKNSQSNGQKAALAAILMDTAASVTPTVDGFPLPVVVIAHKADTLSSNNSDFQSSQQAKVIQGQLRSICLSIGAALVYTSAFKDADVVKLRRYLQHRLFPEALTMDLDIEDATLDGTFIPAGFDTHSLVSISTGFPSDDSFAALPAAVGVHADEADNAAAVSLHPTVQVELEPEKDWLNGLQAFVNQVVAAAGPVPTSSSSSSTGASIAASASLLARTNSESNIGTPSLNSVSAGASVELSSAAASSSSTSGIMAAATTTMASSSRRLSSATGAAVSSNISGYNAAHSTSMPDVLSATADGSMEGGEAKKPINRRITAARAPATQQQETKQDVDDFFKNLLASKPKK